MAVRTPDALLDAAEALFASRGYEGVGIREIADRADANVASIRYHFGGKRELYVAMVRRAMRHRPTLSAWQLLEQSPRSRRDAATLLCRFIRNFLDGLLGDSRTAVCARLFQQEASSPSEAIDDVVRDFIAPNVDALSRTIARIDPDRAPDEFPRLAQFVLGLLLHYHVSRTFIERLTDAPLDRGPNRAAVADDIARFTLRGLRTREDFIDRALEESRAPATPPPASAAPKGTSG